MKFSEGIRQLANYLHFHGMERTPAQVGQLVCFYNLYRHDTGEDILGPINKAPGYIVESLTTRRAFARFVRHSSQARRIYEAGLV